jgi:hypothetical protein
VVGELIRNPALRLLPLEFPTFPQAIVKKEKEPKRKKTTTAVPLLSSKLAIANRTIRGIRSFENDTSRPHIAVSAALDAPLNDLRKSAYITRFYVPTVSGIIPATLCH